MPASGGATIADLPEEVLIRIVSLLSAVDAARTAVLSTQWRNIWKQTTAIHFHQSDLAGVYARDERFIDPVASALLVHSKLSLRTFELSWSWDFDGDADSVRMFEVCLRWAIAHGATDIHLDFAEREGHDCPFTHPAKDDWANEGSDAVDSGEENDSQDGDAVDSDEENNSDAAGNDEGEEEEEALPDADDDEDRNGESSESSDSSDDDYEDSSDESSENSYTSDDDDNFCLADQFRDTDGSDGEESESGLFPLYMPLLCNAKLQMLRLKSCWMSKIPDSPKLKFLESLELVRVQSEYGSVQRLLSGCPILTNLVIERCGMSGDLNVRSSPLLRSVTIRCCHSLNGLFFDAPMLQVFKYQGSVPEEGHFLLAGSPNLQHVELSFCRDDLSFYSSSAFWKFIRSFGNVKFLSLTSAAFKGLRLSDYNQVSFSMTALLPGVRHMVIKGRISSVYAGDSVISFLANAPQLETLSLIRTSESEEDAEAEQSVTFLPRVPPPECLANRLRKITLTNVKEKLSYMMLVEHLLRQALVLEEVCIRGMDGSSPRFSETVQKLSSWFANPSTKVTAV